MMASQDNLQIVQAFIDAFSNHEFDRVPEFIVRGTQTGSFFPPSGEPLPATGQRIEIRCCDILQPNNGKIVAGREYYDMASILRQLGLAPRATKTA